MSATLKTAPVLVRPAGSHWLAIDKTSRGLSEPFEKEELYPILEVDAPRAGTVRASFEVSRYVASSWDEQANVSTPMWSDWRIILRDVRVPDPERPDLPHLGSEAAGIGPATRTAIRDACEPIIREWLAGDEYQQSRQRTAADAVCREIDAPRSYTLDSARQTLSRIGDQLNPADAQRLADALDLLDRARALLDRNGDA